MMKAAVAGALGCAFDWLNQAPESISKEAQESSKRTVTTARRKVIEPWLFKNNIIRLILNQESVTQKGHYLVGTTNPNFTLNTLLCYARYRKPR